MHESFHALILKTNYRIRKTVTTFKPQAITAKIGSGEQISAEKGGARMGISRFKRLAAKKGF